MKKHILLSVTKIVLLAGLFLGIFLFLIFMHLQFEVKLIDPEKTWIEIGFYASAALAVSIFFGGNRGRPESWRALATARVYRVVNRSNLLIDGVHTLLLVMSDEWSSVRPKYVEFEVELPEPLVAGQNFAIFEHAIEAAMFVGKPGRSCVRTLVWKDLLPQKSLALASMTT